VTRHAGTVGERKWREREGEREKFISLRHSTSTSNLRLRGMKKPPRLLVASRNTRVAAASADLRFDMSSERLERLLLVSSRVSPFPFLRDSMYFTRKIFLHPTRVPLSIRRLNCALVILDSA